ncbi:uncharacterized protein LOC132695569 isoform X2 [Cylas formicarius]|uniref:uncharacterized protein LOC132695569 isoform X2 n=1 Tax=Cylas formicarius TaxID=197179 RepID=UPI002958BD99|nr:uncharacterized protein LOC132695569 isoform X2 [Cylas formicarius]
MGTIQVILLLITVINFGDPAFGQSDSLKSALNAIDRRTKDLSEYEDEYGYSVDRPDDTVFLNNPDRRFDRAEPIGKPLVDYLDDDSFEPVTKRISTAFRERLEEDKQRQMEELARNLLSNLETNTIAGNADDDYLRQLWERYYGNEVNSYNYATGPVKRYYPSYGIENIGLRKRGRYVENDDEPLYTVHHHVPRDDDTDYQVNLRNRYLQRASNFGQPRYPHSNKRFSVTKRSSNYIPGERKRSVKKQTDPKVEKDLSNIFGKQKSDDEKNATTEKPKLEINHEEVLKNVEKKSVNKEVDINKEVFSPVDTPNNKPKQAQKKAIDWSDYFGLDRRKKSENSGLDKEWLVERFHKAVAITAKKRNAEPLQSIRNHAAKGKKESSDTNQLKEEQRIEDIDAKLKTMEDKIVDDALKYTGAHQDDGDSREIQEVKDNIISRLAAAYSLEKMRNALEEYKNAIANEKARLKQEGKLFDDYLYEEKRVSVPRKEAVDDSRDTTDGDNNIKCTSSEDCHEQNYKTPAEILDSHFANIDQCPAIQRACNDVASIMGHFGHVFERACNIHQMCLLCSDNSWFSPTRQCNTLFLDKAYDLCKGKEECQKEAQRSIRYMLDINRSLQAQSSVAEECEIACPDNHQPVSQ